MSGVTVLLDEAKPLLDQVGSEATARGIALAGARAVGSLVREHLFGLDGQRHREGGTHFYARAARSVTAGAVPQGAAVTIGQTGFRQRLMGGAIYPRKKFLTIPANPETYGKRAREFSDLVVRRIMDPEKGFLRWALVRAPQTRIQFVRRKRADGTVGTTVKNLGQVGGEVMFWLVRSVGQAADPTVLPYAEHMTTVALQAMQTRFQRLQDRRNPNAGGEK